MAKFGPLAFAEMPGPGKRDKYMGSIY